MIARRRLGNAPKIHSPKVFKRSGNVDYRDAWHDVERARCRFSQGAAFRRCMAMLYNNGANPEGSRRAKDSSFILGIGYVVEYRDGSAARWQFLKGLIETNGGEGLAK